MTREIFRCTLLNVLSCYGKGWHRQTYHHTGNPWSEEHCPLYPTKREAQAAEREVRAWTRAAGARRMEG